MNTAIKHHFTPLCWPHFHQKKKHTSVWGYADIKHPQIAKLSQIHTLQELPCVAYTTKLQFFTESLTLSLFQINAGRGDQAIWCSTLWALWATCEWEQWSGSWQQEELPIPHQPQRGGKAEGRGQVGESPVVCIKMGVPFPGTTHWPQWMLNRGLVASTK